MSARYTLEDANREIKRLENIIREYRADCEDLKARLIPPLCHEGHECCRKCVMENGELKVKLVEAEKKFDYASGCLARSVAREGDAKDALDRAEVVRAAVVSDAIAWHRTASTQAVTIEKMRAAMKKLIEADPLFFTNDWRQDLMAALEEHPNV